MRTPRVTIAIPTFNREADLRHALDSALGQSYTDIEVIVSDNASTDGTEELCRERAREDKRLRYHRQDKNIGPQPNWRFLLDQAQGEYFMWHADDDRFHPDFVSETAAVLDQDASVVLCFSDYDQVDEEGTVRSRWRLSHLYPDRDWREARRDFFNYPFTSSTVCLYGLYRTSVLRRTGHPRPLSFRGLIPGLEAPFLANVAKRGRVVVLPKVLFWYNNHAIRQESLAHVESRRMPLGDKLLVYATVQSKLLFHALTARGSPTERAGLANTVVRSSFAKLMGRDIAPPVGPLPPIEAS